MRCKAERLHLRNTGGFTVLEIMVSAFIALIIFGCIYLVFSTGRQIWHLGDTQIKLAQELRKAMDKLSHELYESNEDMVTVGDNSITFLFPVDTDGDGSFVDDEGEIAAWGASKYWGCTQASCYESNWKIKYEMVQNQLIRTVLNGSDTEQEDFRTVIANNITSFQPVQSDGEIDITITATQQTPKGRNLQSSLTMEVRLRN